MDDTVIDLLESAKILAKADDNPMLVYLIEMAQIEARETTAEAAKLASMVG